MGYLNANQKQALFSMFGVKIFNEGLLEKPILPNQKQVKRSIQAIINHSGKVIDAAMRDLDHDAIIGFRRFSKNMELLCVTSADPRGDEETLVVKRSELLRIIASNDECLFCDKKGGAIKRCELRKIALRCQLTPAGSGECPFRREY